MADPIQVTQTAASLYTVFKADILNIYKEFKFLFEKGLSDYIENYRDKYILTNTFLFRSEKVNFYDTYFPLTLKSKTTNIPIEIEKIFEKSKCVTILGRAGSGKTMLLRHLFLDALKKLYEANLPSDFSLVPIVIELRSLNKFNGGFYDYLKKEIFKNNLTATNNTLEKKLKNGGFIFLLDGLDEINLQKSSQFIDELNDFVDRYNKNYFLITSRPGSEAELIPRFETFSVLELNKIQIKKFVELQSNAIDDKELIIKFSTEVDKVENADYGTYLSSPLLLSMFILTIRCHPELPKTKNKFYWNVFDTLCTKHDSLTKGGGYQHDRKSGLSNQQIEDVLKWFGYISFFDSKYDFDDQYLNKILNKIKSEKKEIIFDNDKLIFDLVTSVSILVKDGVEYKFPHRSLQEYFVSSLISEQDDAAKEKFYKKILIPYLTNFDSASDLYLLELLLESDRTHFINNFILYALRNFKKDINEEEMFKRIMYNDIFIYETFSFKKGVTGLKKTGVSGFQSGPKHSLYYHALYFLDIDVDDLFVDSILNEVEFIRLSEYLLEKKGAFNNLEEVNFSLLFDRKEFANSEYYLIFSELGLTHKFIKAYKRIIKKIEEFEKIVRDGKIHTSNLLGFK